MPCFNPLGGWIARTPNDSGKYPVTFRMRSGWVDKPVDLPCGKCLGCLHDKARAWAIRCYHESTLHPHNCFATFTYDDEHLPPRLVKADLQQLFKRMRARGVKFRYFAAGEYGGQFGRPHYHVLFFGQDFLEGRQRLGVDGDYYTNPFLSEVWGNGFHTIAPLEPGSVFYTTGYTLKNLGQDDCFHLASKRPYIGSGWLERYHDDIVRNGFVTIEGKKMPVPPSYLLRPEFALEFDALKDERSQYFRTMGDDKRAERRERLRGKETNLKARINLKRATA